MILAMVLVASACTFGGSGGPTSTAGPPTTTATGDPSSPTTAAPAPSTTAVPLDPPATGDKQEAASDALEPVEGFTLVTDLADDDHSILMTFDAWLPDILIDAVVTEVYQAPNGDRIAVLSVIPLTGLRGDPNIGSTFAAAAAGAFSAADDADAITTVEADTGGTFEIWSDGDGVLLATSRTPAAARAYMVARAAIDTPNEVWDPGSCLYLAPSEPDWFGLFPYAPFMGDLVVPCSGPHNAEVLQAEFIGTSLTEFDAETIEYDRNYECDREYTNTFGLARNQRPSLITYMPDENEWDRGDRYLACVVVLYSANGDAVLFEGLMEDLPNLELVISPGDCTDGSTKTVVSCRSVHRLQYLGTATLRTDVYPTLDSGQFDEACDLYVADLVTNDDAELTVEGLGLSPYAFDQGQREVLCYAIATVGLLSTDVVGSFYGKWSVVDEGAISA